MKLKLSACTHCNWMSSINHRSKFIYLHRHHPVFAPNCIFIEANSFLVKFVYDFTNTKPGFQGIFKQLPRYQAPATTLVNELEF